MVRCQNARRLNKPIAGLQLKLICIEGGLIMPTDEERVKHILFLALSATPDTVGDIYVQALDEQKQISNASQKEAEYYIAQIRGLARQAEIGWRIFSSPPTPSRKLSEEEQIQLITLIATLHSFCYGAERLDEASFVTGPDSAPIRFYINSLYHFIAALYLLNRDDDPIGGMVYKTLNPMGLSSLLDPIKEILEESMEGGYAFGETVRRIRNKFMVHGTFSPGDVSTVVKKTKLHDMTQLLRLTSLIWELFNRSFVLKLQLISLLTAQGVDTTNLAKAYAEKIQYPVEVS
jgi:hypothetical protein